MAEFQQNKPSSEPAVREKRVAGSSARRRNACIYLVVLVVLLAADVATKAYFNGFESGERIAGPFFGAFQFTLVHNTGAAWGMFGDMTLVLGVVAVVVCVLLTLYLFAFDPNASAVTAFGCALVCAGGIGNALDRFTLGYVVDFIEPVFIDFPVFNVADIGVTCGVVLFLVGLLLSMRNGEGN